MDPEEVEAIFASIDEKIQESIPTNIAVKKSDIPEDDAVLSVRSPVHHSNFANDYRVSTLVSLAGTKLA